MAEIAVTIVIVGIAMVLLLQGLGGARAQAYYTKTLKIANQLARETLGDVASGMYRDDADYGLEGTYADEGYPEFSYAVYFGTEEFPQGESDGDEGFDSWDHQRRREEQRKQLDEEDGTTRVDDPDEDEIREPYEEIQIRITFPVIGNFPNEYVLTQWLPWDQVYGPEEEDDTGTNYADPAADPNNNSSSSAR